MFTINITPHALEDIHNGIDYYNSRSLNLGFRFADEVENSLQAIVKVPVAYSCRYKNVRAKLLYKFPYLIFLPSIPIITLLMFSGFLILPRILSGQHKNKYIIYLFLLAQLFRSFGQKYCGSNTHQ
jgi:hypothetical protein